MAIAHEQQVAAGDALTLNQMLVAEENANRTEHSYEVAVVMKVIRVWVDAEETVVGAGMLK